jgi:hypothetical protein
MCKARNGRPSRALRQQGDVAGEREGLVHGRAKVEASLAK